MKTDKGKLYYGTGIDNSQLRADAAESKNILHDIGNTAAKEGDQMDKTFRQLGKTVVGVFTAQKAADFARKVVSVRGEIESLQKSFEILAGKTQGAKLFGDIKDFAVHTPMLMGDLAKGAQTMLSFNIQTQDVMKYLKQLGDVSMGNSEKFDSLVLAFSRTIANGRLMGEELNMMIDRGFNPLSIISEKTGKSVSLLREEMAAGAISADMVKDAFESATSEGGKFYNMLESQSQVIKGALSNVEGAIDDMFNEIGTKAQGFIVGGISITQSLIENYEKVGEVIAEVVATYGVYKAAVMVLTVVEKARYQATLAQMAGLTKMSVVTDILKRKTEALNIVMAKNPYALVGLAVATLAIGIYKLATYQNDAEKAQSKLNDAIKESKSEIASETAQVDILFARLKAAKGGTQEYEAAKKAIINQYGEYLQGLNKEIANLEDIEAAYNAITIAATKAARARAMEKFTKEAADDYGEKVTDAREDLYEALKKQYKGQKDKDGVDLVETYYWKIVPVLEGKEKMTSEIESIIKPLDKSHYMSGDPMTGIGSYSYTTNAARDAINEGLKARNIMNNVMNEARLKFGDVPESTSEDNVNNIAPIVKNKKYWEDYKKEQQGLLDAMTDVELQSEEAKKIKKNIAEADKKIGSYNVLRENKNGESETKENNKIALETADRLNKINNYKEVVSAEISQAELDIRQAQINAEEDGFSKKIKQNKLNYDRMILENQKRQKGWLEALRDAKELEWENSNPKAKEKGESFDRSSITYADLSNEQLSKLKEYAKIAGDYQTRENKKALDEMFQEFLTYNQQREKIEKEFAEKRAALYSDGGSSLSRNKTGDKTLREGVTQGNANELDTQEQNALDAIDQQFASREASYEAWCNEITTLTLEQLIDVLQKAEEELKALEESGATDSQIAEARAKVTTAKKAVSKTQAKNDINPSKRSIKEWEDLYKVLNECNSSFEQIGNTVGGVAGEIIASAGGIMSSSLSMINGIVQLVQMSATGITGTATAAATAISTMEKASVILTVISAAMQIAMQIINLFNNDKQKEKEIESLQGRIDQLQWELDHADIVRLQQEQGKSIDIMRKALHETYIELINTRLAVNDVQGAWRVLFSTVSNNQELLTKSAEKIATAYANVSYTADKAFGAKKYESSIDQLNNIAKQQLQIQEQINKENSKKKDKDQGRIDEWKKKIEELGAEAVAIINEMVEDIIGGTSNDVANDLAKAFFDAFEAGEDAAEAWGDKVKDIVGDIVKRMLISKFLEEPLGELFNEYKNKWFKDGKFQGLDAVIDSMGGFANDLNSVGKDFEEIWDALPDDIKNMIGGTTAAREASQKGIATASQESVDELNGRTTAIQGHTFSINESIRSLLMTANLILQSVLNIDRNTEVMSSRIEKMEGNMKDVRDTVNDIALKGIKIK